VQFGELAEVALDLGAGFAHPLLQQQLRDALIKQSRAATAGITAANANAVTNGVAA